MSPDIEWQVGEDADQETIARVTTDRPSRWRKPIVLMAAALGLGLGMLYTSIPEPPQPIAPPTSPAPTATPFGTPLSPEPDLAEAIDREARALASGDMPAFISLLDPDEYDWRQDQISSFIPWGAPPSNDEFYRILDTTRLDAQHAWADVIQARDGKFFRETRLYRLLDGEWLRTPVSDPAWWGAARTITTRYFQIMYLAADDDAVRLLAGVLAHEARETCRTFGCNFDEQPPVVNFIFKPDAGSAQPRGTRGSSVLTVTLPSPRLTGYYTADFSGVDIDDERWERYFDQHLYFPLLHAVVGGADRWRSSRNGLMYVYAVGSWDLTRRERALSTRWKFPYRPDLITGTLALTDDEMWQWPSDVDVEKRLANASALVQFIDETYGRETVLRFFRTLRFAQSLTHALSRLGVPYEEFEQKWQAWLKTTRG